MSYGAMTAVMQLVGQLAGPFVDVSGLFPQLVAVSGSAERLRELEGIRADDPEPSDGPLLYERMTALRAERLSFSYDGDSDVLRQVSFTIPKGCFAAVTGPSGIGKSTLLKLMLGVLHPDKGVLCADTPDGSVPLNRQTRRLFAYVPQGNLLMSGTLWENLTLANPGADRSVIWEALRVSGLEDVVSQLPLGLDTPLGENAAGLSEGQAQRLSIARAIVGGAPILLLDEATSALDAETERGLLRRLAALKNRTVIVVTHRPAALELAQLEIRVEAEGATVQQLN